MLHPQHAAVDRLRLIKQRLSIRIPLFSTIQIRKIIQGLSYIWVIRTQHATADRKSLRMQRLGLVIPLLGTIQLRKIIEARRRSWVIRP